MHRSARWLVTGLLLAGCAHAAEREPAPGPKRVRCEPAQNALRKDSIEVRGTVAPLPDRDSQLAAQVSGRVLRVEVREGDRVRVGQVIARVDDAPLRDAAHQSEAAQQNARAEFQHAQASLERVRNVFEHGIVPKQDVEDAVAKLSAAAAAQTEAEALVRQAQRQIDRAIVRSPLQGVVLKVFRKAGELVDGTPATAIAEIADLSALELVADVPAQDLVRLKPAALASLHFDALPEQTLTGTVSRVAPAVDRATGVGSVRVSIQQTADLNLPVGTFGVARVESGAASNVTLVSERALRSVLGDEGELVLCGSDRRAHVTRVHAGKARNGLLEVRGPVQAGQAFAVEPVLGIEDGDLLEVLP